MKQISATLQPAVVVCFVYIDVDFKLLPSSANMCLCVHVRACMCLRVARARVRAYLRSCLYGGCILHTRKYVEQDRHTI